jgi:hypothetical protein
MSTILGILTAVALVVAAFLGFKNKEAYENKIAERIEQEKIREKNKQTKVTTLKDRDQTKLSKENQEVEAKKKGEQVAILQKQVDALKQEVEAKKQQIVAQQAQLEILQTQINKLGDTKELVAKLRRTNEELAQLETDLSANTNKLASLTAEKNKTMNAIEKHRKENDYRSKNQSNPNLATRITNIFGTYGFVTLGAGNNSGVVGGSTLEVVRDGSTIAKLLVKTVEASTSAAELIPDSIKNDTVLMIGDTIKAQKIQEIISSSPLQVATTKMIAAAPKITNENSMAVEAPEDSFAAPTPRKESEIKSAKEEAKKAKDESDPFAE